MSIATLAGELLLRTTSNPDISTKGSELTFGEGDNNFIAIYNFLKELSSGAGLNPYNPATGYTGTVYVSFGGNIYQHIAGGTSTGITPGTNPAVWQLTSIGELIHPVNQDDYLDFGGANQVSAADLYELLNNQTIQATQAELVAAIGSATIVPNRIYEITDLAFTTASLLLFSTSVRSVSVNGVLVMRVADPAQVNPWSPTATYAVDDYVANSLYGLEVYKNITGSNNPNLPAASDGTNWQMQNKAVSSKYKWSYFDAQVTIDHSINTITIEKITDRYGNQNGRVLIAPDPFFEDGNRIANICDGGSSFTSVQTLNGQCNSNALVYSSVSCIGGDGNFSNNSLIKGTVVFQDTLDGDFNENIIEGCQLTFAGGLNSGSTIQTSRFTFTGLQVLRVRAGASFTGKIINESGSNAQDTIVITGLTNINLALNGVPDVYGEFILSSTNATESISRFINGVGLFPIKIMPESGLTITINCTAYGSIGIDGQVMGASASYSINGSRGEYIVLEPATVGIFSVYRVKSSNLVL